MRGVEKEAEEQGRRSKPGFQGDEMSFSPAPLSPTPLLSSLKPICVGAIGSISGSYPPT